jgi:glycosyltransferase involved in cell wall biosynthesis
VKTRTTYQPTAQGADNASRAFNFRFPEEALKASPLWGTEALVDRSRAVLAALGRPMADDDPFRLLQLLADALAPVEPGHVWLAISVLSGELPESAQVIRIAREMRLNGPVPPLVDVLSRCRPARAGIWPRVEVVSSQVLVDVYHTSRNLFATGIQRVAREVSRRWARDHDVVFIGWRADYANLRRLTTREIDVVLKDSEPGSSGADEPGAAARPDVLVPWRCTHLIPELPAEPGRASRYQALLAYSASSTGLIGYDCVPLTASETAAEGMSGAFANFLSAAAHADRVATISEATATEFQGWKQMLAGAGHRGPEIRPVALPVEARVPSESALEEARGLLRVGSLPIVLSVGSHEPRKNHVNVLHAAEILWREGLQFTLTFVGGNSWRSDRFAAFVGALQAVNRPLQVIKALPDELLWAAYRVAYCTVFPSLHEGFGLPVAESLASGTPVVTSNFGSMRELARSGGALLVDPRNVHDLAGALRRLLVDEALRDQLSAEASQVPGRSWDQYGAETWSYLVPEGTSTAALPSASNA